MWNSVAVGELPQAEGGACIFRPDEGERCRGGPHQDLASCGERGNQDVRNNRMSPDRLPHSRSWHEQHGSGFAHDTGDEDGLAG